MSRPAARIRDLALGGLAILLLQCIGCTAPPPQSPIEPQKQDLRADNSELYARARTALASAQIDAIRWGLLPYVAPEEIVARYSPIIERVSEHLGYPMEVVVGDDYRHLESMIVRGSVDVGVLGPYAYVRARKEQPGLSVFASHVALGSTTYGSYILTHEDTGFRSLDDLKGRSFAFVDRRSTSGWLSPAARMLDAGINPERDISARYLGSHEKVFDAIAARQVDAGAVYGASLSEGRKRNPSAGQVVVLAKCERIPYDAYVARAGLPEVVSEALAAALGEISTRDAQGRKTLSNLARINGFIPVDDTYYDTIRNLERKILDALGPEVFAPVPEPIPEPAKTGKAAAPGNAEVAD